MKIAPLATLTFALLSAVNLTAADAAPEVVSKLIATTYGGQNLHRVSSDGKIVPFKLPAGTNWGGGGPEGSGNPAVSPDGKLIAYIQKGGIQIRSMAGGKSTAAVSGYDYETLLITGWTPDSTRLVYFLGPPQADDAPPSKIKNPQYFVYDVKAKSSRGIKIQGSLCGWLPGGKMLLHDGEHGTLSAMSPVPGAQVALLSRAAAGWGQIVVSPDGKRIAVSSSKPNDTSGSQLVAVDLDSGKVSPLSPPGDWAEYQWPKWSPSGKRMAWLKRVSMVDGHPKSVIEVDGKSITKPADVFDHEWLTDTSLVLIGLETLAVIDADTGKEIGGKALPKEPE